MKKLFLALTIFSIIGSMTNLHGLHGSGYLPMRECVKNKNGQCVYI